MKRRTNGHAVHPDLVALVRRIQETLDISYREMGRQVGTAETIWSGVANGTKNIKPPSAIALARTYGAQFGFEEAQVVWWMNNPNGDTLRALPAGPGSLAFAGDPALAEAQADLTEQLAALRRQHPDDDQFRRLPRLATASMRALDDAIAAERRRILAGYQHVAADHGIPAEQQDRFVDLIMARNAAWDARHGAPDDGES